jgi:hypothetical protein
MLKIDVCDFVDYVPAYTLPGSGSIRSRDEVEVVDKTRPQGVEGNGASSEVTVLMSGCASCTSTYVAYCFGGLGQRDFVRGPQALAMMPSLPQKSIGFCLPGSCHQFCGRYGTRQSLQSRCIFHFGRQAALLSSTSVARYQAHSLASDTQSSSQLSLYTASSENRVSQRSQTHPRFRAINVNYSFDFQQNGANCTSTSKQAL